MQKVKEKKCECGVFFKPFNSLQKYCNWQCEKKYKPHSQKPKKVFSIRKVSKKQAELNKIYSKLRLEFLLLPENQICPITKQPTTDIHHKHAGSNRSKYFLETSTWLAVSRDGHIWIHENTIKAKELGYLF
jgi:hypothetical protein